MSIIDEINTLVKQAQVQVARDLGAPITAFDRQPLKKMQPVKQMKPARPAQPAKPAKPAQLAKPATPAQPAKPAQPAQAAPTPMSQRDFRSQITNNLKALKDPNGYYKQQQAAGNWDQSQIDDMSSHARYIKAVLNNPNATLQQQKDALRRSRYLSSAYGTAPKYNNMPAIKAKYGDQATINPSTKGLEVKGKISEEDIPAEAQDFWKQHAKGRDLAVGSRGQIGVNSNDWVELAPGVRMKPRMVLDQNGKLVMDSADKAVIDRYRRNKQSGIRAIDRVPTVVYKGTGVNRQPYIRVNGRLIPYDQYMNPQAYAMSQRRVYT